MHHLNDKLSTKYILRFGETNYDTKNTMQQFFFYNLVCLG